MLRTLTQLLGDEAYILYRYLALTLIYGLLSGLSIATILPLLGHLLDGDTPLVHRWLLVLSIAVMLCWGLRRQVEKAGIRVGVAVLRQGRQRIGEHVAQLPIGWFTTENTAHLSYVTTQGMMSLAQLPAHVFTPLISGLLVPLVVILVSLVLNLWMGLIGLLSLPLLLGCFAITARQGQRADQRHHRQTARASQRMVEFAQAQAVLRAFNGENAGQLFLEQAIAAQQQSAKQLIRISAMSVLVNTWTVQIVFAAMLVATMLWFSDLANQTLSLGAATVLVLALFLACRFIDPLLEVASYSEILRSARSQLAAVGELFAARPLPQGQGMPITTEGLVELQDVSFRYAEDQPQVLQQVSLRIAPGSMTALIGASGSGKTTVMRLIARFFDVSHGSVKVGGVDVRQLSSEQLAQQISQIFQDTYLFQGSIADNIRIGKTDASDAEVLQVAREAGVLEMLERLPQGLNTPVGEGGVRLSGGERQRIAIARALIKDAPILLVDEATAALDAENQAAISETLHRLRGKRTLIVIAHQLSTIAMADHLVVLDKGKISQQGSPAQLSDAPGLYAHFLAQRRTAKGWRLAANSLSQSSA